MASIIISLFFRRSPSAKLIDNPFCLTAKSAKLTSFLNSFGIQQDSAEKYADKLLNLTSERIAIHGEGNFPLIPHLYAEYSNS